MSPVPTSTMSDPADTAQAAAPPPTAVPPPGGAQALPSEALDFAARVSNSLEPIGAIH
jgi:hypothetical protein